MKVANGSQRYAARMAMLDAARVLIEDAVQIDDTDEYIVNGVDFEELTAAVDRVTAMESHARTYWGSVK